MLTRRLCRRRRGCGFRISSCAPCLSNLRGPVCAPVSESRSAAARRRCVSCHGGGAALRPLRAVASARSDVKDARLEAAELHPIASSSICHAFERMHNFVFHHLGLRLFKASRFCFPITLEFFGASHEICLCKLSHKQTLKDVNLLNSRRARKLRRGRDYTSSCPRPSLIASGCCTISLQQTTRDSSPKSAEISFGWCHSVVSPYQVQRLVLDIWVCCVALFEKLNMLREKML